MPPEAFCSRPHALALKASTPTISRSSSYDQLDVPLCRYCWSEGGDEGFVSPCACIGTTQHVHYKCLVRWVAAGKASRKQATATHCEICKHRFFGTSRQHELLLATASAEMQLSQLYSAAQYDTVGGSGSNPQARALAWAAMAGAAMERYWTLALRPIQAAMLVYDLLPPAGTAQGGRWAASAAALHATCWFAGKMCTQWVTAYAQVGGPLFSGLAALASLLFASGAGGSLRAWLQGQRVGVAAFHLRLPLSLPLFPHISTALALLGTLLPGKHSGADGMRAAALAPLLVLKWVLSAGSRRRLGSLLSTLCRLLSQGAQRLRAAVVPLAR